MLVNAIWDFDGTLYNSYPGMMKALAALVTANGGQIEPKTLYRQVKETSIKQFLTGFGQQVGRSVADLEADYHQRARAYLQDIHPYPEALAVLKAINPAVTAMIGDRSLDVDAGINADVKTIYFNVDGLNAAPQADYQVDHLIEIPPLFCK